jgi:predicted RNase H-like HicB family nuclease
MAPDKPSMLDEPFDVHVESNRQGHTVAHIPLLPGCIVRAQSPEQALSYVEEAITLYLHHSMCLLSSEPASLRNTKEGLHRDLAVESLYSIPTVCQ